MIQISPSILSADFSKLGEAVMELENAGADMIHIDVMDGNFVPNISFGMPVVKGIRNLTKVPFDIHLMIAEPSKYVEEFINLGGDIISIHYEADKHIDRTIGLIKSCGAKAAIALNPGTPVELIKDLIPKLDMVLIMSVNPGFGGQKFIDYSLNKIKKLSEFSKKLNPNLLIEVDGGIGVDNIKSVVEAGANVIVAGSAVFKNNELKKNIQDLRRLCQ